MGEVGSALLDAVGRNAAAAGAYLPRLLVFLIVLVFGYALARLLGRGVDVLLSRLGLDRLGEQTGLIEDLARVGLQTRPARLVGRVVYAIVLVATLVQAADAPGLAPLSDALRRLLEFSPNLILAVAILFGGAVVGELLARTAGAALARAGVLYHAAVGTLVRVLILFLALLMALQQLTIQASFLFYILLIVLGMAGLGGAIAFGWGARTLAEHVAGGRYVEQNFDQGESVVVNADGLGAVTGTIERLGLTSTTIRTTDGRRVVVPNGVLARAVVQADAAPGAGGGDVPSAPPDASPEAPDSPPPAPPRPPAPS